MKNPVI